MTTHDGTDDAGLPVFIRATPEQIWDAITKPEFTQQYFYGARIERADDGRRFSADRRAWSGTRRCSRPTRRAGSCTGGSRLYDPELAAEEPSRVTWEIEPQDGGITMLTVVHDQLEGAPKTAESVAGGWMYVLSGLKTLLETGKPLAG